MQESRFLPLCALVAAAAKGDADGVAGRAGAALAAGCAAEDVREALRTVPPFCGFPRALDAFAAAAPVLAGAAPGPELSPGPERDERGLAFFARVYGSGADRVREGLRSLDPLVAGWVLEDAYGRVLSRPEMDAGSRERLAVALLAAQGLRNQLPGHVRGALRCGATETQVAATLDAAAPWVDPEILEAARAALREAAARLT